MSWHFTNLAKYYPYTYTYYIYYIIYGRLFLPSLRASQQKMIVLLSKPYPVNVFSTKIKEKHETVKWPNIGSDILFDGVTALDARRKWSMQRIADMSESYMKVSRTKGTPRSSIYRWIFPYKPSVLGTLFAEHPYRSKQYY